MIYNNYTTIGEIAYINPPESLKKGKMAAKIGMDCVIPFCRDVPGYERCAYTGGAKFRNGDTVMARITPCLENGKTFKVTTLNDNEVGFGSTEFITFRAVKDKCDPDYLYYLIRSPYVRNASIKSMVGSSGRQRVQTDVVTSLPISVPDLKTQKRIGFFLSLLDDKILSNKRTNDNLEEQIKILYQAFITSHSSKSWRYGRLQDLAEVCYGKDHKKLLNGLVPVYGSGGVMRHVDRSIYDKESVLIPRKGTLNNVKYVDEPFWSVDTMFYTKMKLLHAAKYLHQFLIGIDLASYNAGSAVPSMTTEILNSLKVKIPTNSELTQFETMVVPLYLSINNNNKSNDKLADLRDALLPQLMSGEIDVSDIGLSH